MAKGLASGFPISAIGASAELMDRWPKGSHGGTYGGNPIGCAAALATIDVLTEPGFLDARERPRRAAATPASSDLARRPGRRPRCAARGSWSARARRSGQGRRAGSPGQHCRDDGHLLLMNAGTYNDVLRFMPPLVVSEAEIATALAAFAAALTSTA